MNCPILNHPLVKGVLVESDELIKFIRRKVPDFLRNEQICSKCHHTILTQYNNKLERAKILHLTRLHQQSASTLKNSTSSSKSSHSHTTNDSIDQLIAKTPMHKKQSNDSMDRLIAKTPMHRKLKNGKTTNVTNSTITTNSSSESSSQSLGAFTFDKSHNLSKSHQQTPKITGTNTKDAITYPRLSQEPSTSNAASATRTAATTYPRLSQEPSTSNAASATASRSTSISTTTASTATTVRQRSIRDFVTPLPTIVSNGNDSIISDVSVLNATRNSEQPTTSRAAAAAAAAAAAIGNHQSRKRTISPVDDPEVIDSEDDEPRLSLNAYNGMRLPNIQPLPPKRRPKLNHPGPDVMDNYIKDITGG